MSFWWDIFRQSYFIPEPSLTEKNLSDQSGRVFIVTGGYAGCGKALANILYGRNGTVYIAGRSEEKGKKAIDEIKNAHPASDGRLEFLKVDLSDLTTIKGAVEDFSKREQRLDVLTNNAGVMTPPVGSKGAQGHELQMVTNCLGPYLFTELLTPLIQKTAASSPPGSVRVTWGASMATAMSPKEGVQLDAQSGGGKVHGNPPVDYAQSKAGNVLLARAYSDKHHKADGIVSNAWNPGNLRTELTRHMSKLMMTFVRLLTYPMVLGAYTELWAGWSEEAGKEENKGKYIGPWGRFVMLRKDIGETKYEPFLEWCEKETKGFR